MREIYLAKLAAEERAKEEQRRLNQQEQEEQQQQQPLPHPVSGDNTGELGDRLDCFGVMGGAARRDPCGVCNGDGSSCADCMGIPNGPAKRDCAGVCKGKDFRCVDCAGVMNGDMRTDVCGICGGDGLSCRDCLGVVNGTAREDACGVCDGDDSSCADCYGIPNGPAKIDPCGVCDGDGTSCCSPIRHARDADAANETTIEARQEEQFRMTLYPDYNSNELCNGHGTCSPRHHFCLCDQGWTGPFCTERQDLCLHMPADACNGHGECDSKTGLCVCYNPEEWMGPRCEFSRCSMRGAYDLKRGRCKCEHGYGGQFCEQCAAEKPRPGKVHLCVEIVGAWQPVPEDLRLPESILLGETDPRAPVFSMIDVEEPMAEAYLRGYHLFNLASRDKKTGEVVRRAAIRPNSTHEDSGYYYDCGCRLSIPPPPEYMTATTDSDSTSTTTIVAREYRPRFAKSNLDDLGGGPTDSRKMALRAREMRALQERDPITLSECQDLLQIVLDEFGFAIDAAIAEINELSEIINSISSSVDHSFGIGAALVGMLAALLIGGITIGCLYFGRKYVRIRQPLQSL